MWRKRSHPHQPTWRSPPTSSPLTPPLCNPLLHNRWEVISLLTPPVIWSGRAHAWMLSFNAHPDIGAVLQCTPDIGCLSPSLTKKFSDLTCGALGPNMRQLDHSLTLMLCNISASCKKKDLGSHPYSRPFFFPCHLRRVHSFSLTSPYKTRFVSFACISLSLSLLFFILPISLNTLSRTLAP